MKRALRRKPDPETMAVCEALRERRLELELRIDDVAERAGVSPSYISDVEGGYRDPSVSTLRMLADAMGISIGQLFGPLPALSADALGAGQLVDQLPEHLRPALLAVMYVLVRSREP